MLSLIGTYDWDLYFYLLGCSTHQNLMSCSRILNSIKGFKLKQLQWSNTTAVVKISPPQFLNASPRKRPVMPYTSEAPLITQEIPEDEIIYIDDDSEDPAPIKQLTHHADKILMPPPVETTLVSRKTVPLPINDQHNQRKRGLASRRKAKPLKLQVHQVARMRTGPVDHQRVQLMTQLTSAVVPLKKLQISETPPRYRCQDTAHHTE